MSVLACRLRPRANAVSAGSARCAAIPAAASSSATYRHPAHPSTANAASSQASEPGQPGPQVRPVGRGDLAAAHLTGLGVEVVEGDLFPVDIQPAYDGHRDLLTLRRGAHASMRIAYAVNRDGAFSELGRSHSTGRHLSSARPDACHLIVR